MSPPEFSYLRLTFDRLRTYVPFSIWRRVRRQYVLYEPNFCCSVANRQRSAVFRIWTCAISRILRSASVWRWLGATFAMPRKYCSYITLSRSIAVSSRSSISSISAPGSESLYADLDATPPEGTTRHSRDAGADCGTPADAFGGGRLLPA